VCCSVLQCVAVCCSVLQCVAVFFSVLQCKVRCVALVQRSLDSTTQVAMFFSVLQCAAVCCSVLQCVLRLRLRQNARSTPLPRLLFVAVCCSVVVMSCGVLQCVAV